MKWIITKDCQPIDETVTFAGKVFWGQEQTRNWHSMTQENRAITFAWMSKACNYEFRLLDDDGEVYYEGECLDLDQANQDQAFAPLDWAAGDGVTEMQYRKKGAQAWETL